MRNGRQVTSHPLFQSAPPHRQGCNFYQYTKFSGESPIEPRKHQHRPCRNGHRSPVGQRSIPPSPTTSGEPKPSPQGEGGVRLRRTLDEVENAEQEPTYGTPPPDPRMGSASKDAETGRFRASPRIRPSSHAVQPQDSRSPHFRNTWRRTNEAGPAASRTLPPHGH